MIKPAKTGICTKCNVVIIVSDYGKPFQFGLDNCPNCIAKKAAEDDPDPDEPKFLSAYHASFHKQGFWEYADGIIVQQTKPKEQDNAG